MELKTKYFGTIDVEEEDALTFPQGLYGFEEETRFYLLPFAGSEGNMLALQSAVTPGLAFVAMNPFSLDPTYAPILPPQELAAMGVNDSKELCYYVLCVVKEPVAESTLNFKCPVVINPDIRRGCQVILDMEGVHMRHRLGDYGKGKAGTVC